MRVGLASLARLLRINYWSNECHQVNTNKKTIFFVQNFTFNKLSFYHHVVWSTTLATTFVIMTLDEIISSITRTRLHKTLNFHIGRTKKSLFYIRYKEKLSFKKTPATKKKYCSTAYIRSEENERGLWRWWGISTDPKTFSSAIKRKVMLLHPFDWTSYETNNSNKWGFWTREKKINNKNTF